MGDWHWSISGCDSRVWWYGKPGQGCDYWTKRFGQYWVFGTVHNIYAWHNYECNLGPPVHPYGFIQEFGGGEGQWMERGCIIFRYQTGGWTTYWGDYGQLWGRSLEGDISIESRFEERALPPGNWPAPPSPMVVETSDTPPPQFTKDGKLKEPRKPRKKEAP